MQFRVGLGMHRVRPDFDWQNVILGHLLSAKLLHTSNLRPHPPPPVEGLVLQGS